MPVEYLSVSGHKNHQDAGRVMAALLTQLEKKSPEMKILWIQHTKQIFTEPEINSGTRTVGMEALVQITSPVVAASNSEVRGIPTRGSEFPGDLKCIVHAYHKQTLVCVDCGKTLLSAYEEAVAENRLHKFPREFLLLLREHRKIQG